MAELKCECGGELILRSWYEGIYQVGFLYCKMCKKKYDWNDICVRCSQAEARLAEKEKELADYKRNDERWRGDELDAVMLSVDKWLEGDALTANPATRAADAREVALKAIEAKEKELAVVKNTIAGLNGVEQKFLEKSAELTALRSRVDGVTEEIRNHCGNDCILNTGKGCPDCYIETILQTLLNGEVK